MVKQNGNLKAAKAAKNDEFYTQLTDIEKELKHYKHHFKDKVVFCNCDDPEWSEFWNYFKLNFDELGLKKLISTHYVDNDVSDEPHSYKLELTEYNGTPIRTDLVGNGDFTSDECIKLLEEADIVVTNPAFSTFRAYVKLLMDYNKKFLIIGNKNAITYKEFFPYLKDKNVWIGHTQPQEFRTPDGMTKQVAGLCRWFTNLETKKRNGDVILWRKYYNEDGTVNEDAATRYRKYDNYDAINVDKVSDIPIDYYGVMGVPITMLDKYNPSDKQDINDNGVSLNGDLAMYFDIVGLCNGKDDLAGISTTKDYRGYREIDAVTKTPTGMSGMKINGNPVLVGKPSKGKCFKKDGHIVRSCYARIFIKRKGLN